jgi:hypothetical protein
MVSKAFSMSKNTAAVFIVEIKGHVVRWTHTLHCRAVTCTESKEACIKQASVFNVVLENFYNGFLE